MTSTTTVREGLQEILKRNVREDILDRQPHFVPLSIESLRVSLLNGTRNIMQELSALDSDDPTLEFRGTFSEFTDELYSLIEAKFTRKVVLTSIGPTINGTPILLDDSFSSDYKSRIGGPAIVYDQRNKIIGALFSSFDSAGAGLFTPILNKVLTKYIRDGIYEGVKTKKGFDRGHILGLDSSTSSVSSPLELKIKSLIDRLTQEVSTSSGTRQSDLSNVKSSIESQYNKLKHSSQYGVRITQTFSKELTDFIIATKANIVIVQDSYENRTLYGTRVEGEISRYISNILPTVNYSRNILEEVKHRVLSTLSGKKVTNTKVTKKFPDLLRDIILPGNKPVLTVARSTSTTSVARQIRKPVTPNLTSLQALLQQGLHDQIRKNMGTGNSKRVLNYETGRFARSAKIERLAQSREGTISAFYSYMKNPYATFSDGGTQSSPRTRDPKTLISGSIRELAAAQVSNRLRAVLV